MKILVVDDDCLICENVKSKLHRIVSGGDLSCQTAVSVVEAKLLVQDQPPDILITDLNMPGISGISLIKYVKQHCPGTAVYVLSGYDDYHLVRQAFLSGADDYLLKPVEEKQFEKTMERLYASMRSAGEDSMLIQKGYEGRIVQKDEIIFCEIIDRKIYLNLTSGEVLDYYEQIENLETKLGSHFFRCHRSYLINLKHLKGYKNGTAYMDNGREVPVSRLRSKEFSGVILQYMKNR